MLYKYPYQSELGIITLLANDHGLLGAWFENQENYGGRFDLDNVQLVTDLHQSTIINQSVKWLDAHFSKQPFETIDFQLNPQGTAFQQDVWLELGKIPYGEMITIGELVERIMARQTKGQGTAKMIAGAIYSNPISIMIPSHRILISNDQSGNHLATNHLGQLLREFERS
ncbi:methylated-DNA--[protein]-cysteine S-methyltransferase [Aerococcus viridans]|uniref:methylated-DNA--[protein]-cysteine S-methyltransferase n=1 Tax=Aerococcus viridans TaxID=1377 RepID=UPI00223BD079|nr:methylated-DNA--[protein]-cysteine S-methyltransferase [Aerococcus viridans]MCT1797261.1 methylated-DNA--[protein]-cysteine S-methyltransferase [Aerococcus viridans]